MLVVVAGLIVALAAELRQHSPARAPQPPATRSVENPQQLADLRRRAELPPCPSGPVAGPDLLRSITVQCMADGSNVDAGRMMGGRAALVNLWAYWCQPCRTELPAMAQYQRRVGPAVTVVTVHQDDDEAAGLALLADLGVRLPAVQDGGRGIAAALRVPNVMPATVALRKDGSVAAILPRAFASADEIAAAVDQTIGVPQ